LGRFPASALRAIKKLAILDNSKHVKALLPDSLPPLPPTVQKREDEQTRQVDLDVCFADASQGTGNSHI
jgi:hypothetical protein